VLAQLAASQEGLSPMEFNLVFFSQYRDYMASNDGMDELERIEVITA
jgi:hypothetical protein